MDTQTLPSEGGSVTCGSCLMTVGLSAGTRRTICPFCGNFYNPTHASVTQRKHDRPKAQEDPRCSQRDDRSGGRLQAISNFFHNLGPNKRGKNVNSPIGRSSADTPPTSSSSTRSAASSQPMSPTSSATARASNLPPIAQDSTGRLTAGEGNKLDSNVKRQDGRGKSPRSGPAAATRPESTGRPRSAAGRPRSAAGRPPSARSRTRSHSGNSAVVKLEDYPYRDKTVNDLTADVLKAKVQKDWKNVSDYFSVTFDSFTEINAAFREQWMTAKCGSVHPNH